MHNQTQRHILVTGANKGIGKGIVIAILNKYHDTFVYLCSRSLVNGHQAADEIIGTNESFKARLSVLQLDVNSDDSVKAASNILKSSNIKLYALVNNAGIATGDPYELINTNFYGTKRVIENFIDIIIPNGKIVSISSGTASMLMEKSSESIKSKMINPMIESNEIESIVQEYLNSNKEGGVEKLKELGYGTDGPSLGYGFSKALLNLYTIFLARTYKEKTITCCSPGLVKTDLFIPMATNSGTTVEDLWSKLGAIDVSESTISTERLLFNDVESGCYYGSDGLRSPMTAYRKPGISIISIII